MHQQQRYYHILRPYEEDISQSDPAEGADDFHMAKNDKYAWYAPPVMWYYVYDLSPQQINKNMVMIDKLVIYLDTKNLLFI